MKIALLTEKYTPDIGGLAISTSRLARLLDSAGHSVRVFAPAAMLQPGELRVVTQGGIVVQRFGAAKRTDDTLQTWFELVVREHRRDPFDLIHAYFLTQAGFVAAFAAHYLDLPSVVSARGNDLDRAIFDPTKAGHILFALREASAVTANTDQLARKAGALVPGLEAAVIPNGVDTQQFRPIPRDPTLRRQIGFGADGKAGAGDPFVIGFAGELRDKKGLESIARGYTQVAKKFPSGLLIAGQVRSGEDQQRFESLTGSNPSRGIVVTGYLPPADLPAYYAQMDVFVQPSIRDGLPNALLEAMACELPIVATAVGGMAELITDRQNGRLVPVNEPAELAAAIEALLADRNLAAAYGRAARKTVEARHTLRAELDGNLSVYRKLGMPA